MLDSSRSFWYLRSIVVDPFHKDLSPSACVLHVQRANFHRRLGNGKSAVGRFAFEVRDPFRIERFDVVVIECPADVSDIC
jgi:hypothetical protein